MSELTVCNYCNLQDLKERYGEENIFLFAKDDWIEVRKKKGKEYEPIGVSFLALPLQCVC